MTANVLILTPVKTAAKHLPGYFALIERLTYPKSRLSLGFLEGDSLDDTYEVLTARLPELRRSFRRVDLWRKNFNYNPPPGVHRWQGHLQIPRRTVLAKARNHLLFHALQDEDWVLWIDVDVIDYPPDIIERLLSYERNILHPHCVLQYGGETYDRNGWRDNGRRFLADYRGGPDLVRLDSVGGTMLMIRADIHRDGLIFPPYPYGPNHPRARYPHPFLGRKRGELETEGLGLMAMDMGHNCWGLPNLEIQHAPE